MIRSAPASSRQPPASSATRAILALFQQAMDSGELRADLEPLDASVVMVGISTITGWAAMNGKTLPEGMAERMIDVVYRGIQEVSS